MRDYTSDQLRNITLAGHQGSGKTTVLEAMLFKSGGIERMGDGTLDYDPEEIRRHQTIYTKLAPVEWKDCKINFIDTPGYLDFEAEALSGYRVGDSTLIIVDGKDGVRLGTQLAFERSAKDNKPTIFFINKMDDEHASFHRTYEQCRDLFGKTVIAFELPIRDQGKVIGSVNILNRKAWYYEDLSKPREVPEAMQEEVDACWEQVKEAVALSDEALMEKYFSGESFSHEELLHGICSGVRSGEIRPVYCGSATDLTGIERLLDLIVEYFPAYAERQTIEATDPQGQVVTLRTAEDETLSAFVYKTIMDPFVGRISYIKVMTGTLRSDMTIRNVSRDVQEKIGQIYSLRGKYQLAVGKLFTGDIGVLVKLSDTHTNDTLSEPDRPVIYPPLSLPVAMLGVAIWPKTKNDEDKLSQAMARLLEEDLSLRFEKNPETNEQVLYGLGDQHLDVVLAKLKSRFKVEVDTTRPKIPYRETIRKKVSAEGKHKKQSGGAGQYGDVFITFEPCAQEEMVFAETVFGGAVPRQFFPAVEAGLREAMVHGILAGYKVVGVKATLTDGKYHEVDSKEIAFKLAAKLAYKEAMPKADPIILEPIVHLEVVIPDAYTGPVIGDLNKRRGIIIAMEPEAEKQRIIAEVPLGEVMTYATDLRSISQGYGTYTQHFERYDPAPEDVSKRVIEQAKKETNA